MGKSACITEELAPSTKDESRTPSGLSISTISLNLFVNIGIESLIVFICASL